MNKRGFTPSILLRAFTRLNFSPKTFKGFTHTSPRLRRVKVASPAPARTVIQTGGFTIVELLVVIVIIGILAAITILAYTGISSKAVVSSLQSNLASAKKQLNLYYVDNGFYPTDLNNDNCPRNSTLTVDSRYCLKPSPSTTFSYSNLGVTNNTQGFGLQATKNNISYIISNTTSPGIISSIPSLSCPTGFITVPGSLTYGTADFCVMKYEAKQVGTSTTPISQATGLPWSSGSQISAIANSPNVAGCTGCHLIKESEWLTIAQNVLNVPSNWSGNAVGSGYIYRGHSDGSYSTPTDPLFADTNDSNGYYGTGNSASDATITNGVVGKSQRRTLTLSNGEVIWDLAGNVSEWTAGTATTGQPGIVGNAYVSYIEWVNATTPGNLSPNPFPATTGISGSGSWTSSNGIGRLTGNPTDSTGVLHAFIRGGTWFDGIESGVLNLYMTGTPDNIGGNPDNTGGVMGFRVAR